VFAHAHAQNLVDVVDQRGAIALDGRLRRYVEPTKEVVIARVKLLRRGRQAGKEAQLVDTRKALGWSRTWRRL
jgi:hypothetical protein